MALPVTSGTASFLVSRDDIIKAALQDMKVLIAGQSPGTNDVTDLSFRLNLILKWLNTLGYLQWLYQTLTPISFVAGQITYTVAESGSPSLTNYRPVRLAHAWRRDNSTPPNDIPLIVTSRAGYDLLTPKTAPGIPNTVYYDPQIGLGTFYVWPVPTDATNSLVACIQRPVQDITGSTQNFDVTQEWFLPLHWILADEAMSMYQVDEKTMKLISMKATYYREKVADFAQEDASLNIQPDMQYQGYQGKFNS